MILQLHQTIHKLREGLGWAFQTPDGKKFQLMNETLHFGVNYTK